jgi:hypothetical protein
MIENGLHYLPPSCDTAMKQHQHLLRSGRAGLLLLAFAAALPGCASIANFAAMRSIPVAGPKNPVRDVACIWQQGEGRDEKGRPCRGFCGQLMFLTCASKKPGIVRGNVSVYVFDNIGTIKEQAKPLKEYRFTPDEWATFQRTTNLGMTYQLFVPYPRTGGHDAECQIHVKFTAEGSDTPMWSQPESIALRGTTGPAAMADAIDKKLTSSSPLYARTPGLPPGANPDYQALLKKLQEDTRPAAERNMPALPSSAGRLPAARNQADISRLQAVLDASAGNDVEQVGFTQPADHRERVSQAVYEENVN